MKKVLVSCFMLLSVSAFADDSNISADCLNKIYGSSEKKAQFDDSVKTLRSMSGRISDATINGVIAGMAKSICLQDDSNMSLEDRIKNGGFSPQVEQLLLQMNGLK